MASQEFIDTINPIAQKVYQKTGILPSVTIAQGILETGGKLNNALAKVYNFFGEKGVGDAGSVSYGTSEYGTSGYYSTTANFKAYSGVEAAAEGRASLLNLSRYKPAQKASTFDTQVKAIKAGGYATSPTYVSNLKSIYQQYNLSKYDTGNQNVSRETLSEFSDNVSHDSNNDNINTISTTSQQTSLLSPFQFLNFQGIRAGVYVIIALTAITAIFITLSGGPKNFIFKKIPGLIKEVNNNA